MGINYLKWWIEQNPVVEARSFIDSKSSRLITGNTLSSCDVSLVCLGRVIVQVQKNNHKYPVPWKLELLYSVCFDASVCWKNLVMNEQPVLILKFSHKIYCWGSYFPIRHVSVRLHLLLMVFKLPLFSVFLGKLLNLPLIDKLYAKFEVSTCL